MNKSGDIPRYTNNIFVSQIKHLTRTLNTLIAYSAVKKISVSFNKEKNKYQLFLDINYNSDHTDGLILLYDRTAAQKKLTNKTDILEKVYSPLSKDVQQLKVLDKLKGLIELYTDDNTSSEYNGFFLEDENTILDKINQIIPDNLKNSYSPKNTNKLIDTKVAKKIYFLIKNQLNFMNLNKVFSLENKRVNSKAFIKKLVDEELAQLSLDITYLRIHRYHDTLEINGTKQEIEHAIAHYYDDSVQKYNLAFFSLEDLQEQLELIKTREWINEADSTYNLHITNEIEAKLQAYFKDYEILLNYINENNKKLTSNTISRYVTTAQNKYQAAKDLNTGIQKRNKIKKIKEEFAHVINLSENAKYHFILKMSNLEKYYDEFSSLSKFDNDNIYDYKPMESSKKYYYNGEYYTEEDLELIGMDIEDIKLINKDMQERKLEQLEKDKFKDYLYENDISENEYNFNNFMTELVEHINSTMDMNIDTLSNIELFDNYIGILENTDELDYKMSAIYEREYNDMLNQIEEYGYERIYDTIEENLKLETFETFKEEIQEDCHKEFYKKLLTHMHKIGFNLKSITIDEYYEYIDFLKEPFNSDEEDECHEILDYIENIII